MTLWKYLRVSSWKRKYIPLSGDVGWYKNKYVRYQLAKSNSVSLWKRFLVCTFTLFFFCCKKYEFYISAVKYFLCNWQHTCIIYHLYKNRSTALQHTMSITAIKSKYLSFLSFISKEKEMNIRFLLNLK